MLGLSFSICASVVPSTAFTAFPGVFSLFGQSRYSSMSLALTLQDNAGVAGAGRVRLLPGCSWGRQPLRRLLGDSPLNESLCTFQLSWPPLAGGTVTTSSPATIMPFCFTRCSVTFRVHRYRRCMLANNRYRLFFLTVLAVIWIECLGGNWMDGELRSKLSGGNWQVEDGMRFNRQKCVECSKGNIWWVIRYIVNNSCLNIWIFENLNIWIFEFLNFVFKLSFFCSYYVAHKYTWNKVIIIIVIIIKIIIIIIITTTTTIIW